MDDIDSLSNEDLKAYTRSLRQQLMLAERRAAPDRGDVRNIYLHVYGGLGNQLFQVAFAIVMRDALGADLNILTISYREDNFRPFLLHMFPGIRARISPPADALGSTVVHEEIIRHMQVPGIVSSMLNILKDNKRIYFSGFWQDERYFKDHRHLIRESLVPEVSIATEEKAKHVRENETIGIHVRRHGYGHMGLARLSYYRDAIEQIRRERGDIPVNCFTDDPSYCQYVFRDIKNFSFLDDGNIYNPLNNFHLLSSCRHHVIANSSFSWWAAWLSEQDDTIIYAPHPWVIPDPKTNPVPQRWRQIPNTVLAP